MDASRCKWVEEFIFLLLFYSRRKPLKGKNKNNIENDKKDLYWLLEFEVCELHLQPEKHTSRPP